MARINVSHADSWHIAALPLFLLAAALVPASSAQVPGVRAGTYKNPVLWEDLPDDDVIRVGDTYYYSASNMHYSPGAPVSHREMNQGCGVLQRSAEATSSML